MSTLGLAMQIGAVLAAIGAATAAGLRLRRPRARPWVNRALVVSVGLLAAAVIVIEVALVTRMTSIAYVEAVTEQDQPLPFRLTSLWSSMDGSLLLWALTIAAVATIGLASLARARLDSPVAAMTLSSVVAATVTISLVASPFVTVDRARPSPLLQDHPAMGVHPPILYVGFALMLVPFALSLAALAGQTEPSRDWRRAISRWTAVGWIALGTGIGIGAWWSYAVLGWGGYWAWDPVENASLLPWLAATVVLHSTGARTSAGGGARWAPALSAVPFLLVLLATFLTRSGVVASVHAFALSGVGVALGAVALAAALVWGALLGRRRLRRPRTPPEPSLGGTLLIAGRFGLLATLGIVLLGTVGPTIIAATTGTVVGLGPPWYARTLAPLAVALLLLMAIAPLVHSRARLRAVVIGAVAAAISAVLSLAAGGDVPVVLAAALAGFVIGSSAARLLDRFDVVAGGSALAHAGVALVGVVVVAGGQSSVVERTVALGEAAAYGPVDAIVVSLDRVDRGAHVAAVATLAVRVGDETVEAHPELRYYPEHGAVVAGPSIRGQASGDVYVSLLDADPSAGLATVRIASLPLIPWLWPSAALVPIGAAVATIGRRGSPTRRSLRSSTIEVSP